MSNSKRTHGPVPLRALGGAALALVLVMGGTGAAMADDPGPSASGAASPVTVARVAFTAWRAGEGATLVRLTKPPVAQVLLARDAGDSEWSEPSCQGAAGSTYCTWTGPDAQLTLRVANEIAAAGRPDSVTEARFDVIPGAVAMWPLTTATEAENMQHRVDEGYRQWLLEPEAVVSAYAQRVLDLEQPAVDAPAPTYFTYNAVDTATGVAVEVSVGQPARTGPGGIWAVIGVRSLPATSGPVPL